MRKLVMAAALASTMGTAPAFARDNSPYVGIEGGLLKAEDTEIDFSDDLDDIDSALILDHDTGIDLDLVAGYDFGAIRAEAEVGYKRAKAEDVRVDPLLFSAPGTGDFDSRTRVLSGMVNALLDFGDDGGVSGFAGGGVGLARVKMRADLEPFAGGFSGTDRSFAWQLLAGVRTAISENVDLGLKYRFFNTKFDFEGDTLQGGASQLDGRFRSHSLLASLIFNFGAPAAPPPEPPAPPPPPPPPATQTCPDGSVILATDNCPLPPPPPPPPPPPAPERG